MATTSPISNVVDALADGVTATTQSASDNSTKVSTTAYVETAVAAGGGATNRASISTVFGETTSTLENNASSGSVAVGADGLQVGTGPTGGSFMRVRKMAPRSASSAFTLPLIFQGNVLFATDIVALTTPTDLSSFWGVGEVTVAGTGHTYTVDQMGFKTVYVSSTETTSATNGDGTTETATALTALGTSAIDKFSLIKTSTTDIKFYQNRVLGATHTTNLPTETHASTTYMQWSVANDSTATETNHFYSFADYQQDIV